MEKGKSDTPVPERKAVAVTGFGPFRDVEDNPSWRAVERLPNEIVGRNGERTSVHKFKVPVVYSKALAMSKKLAYQELYTAVIHVGMGRAGAIRFETQARRSGYKAPGTSQDYPPSVIDDTPYKGVPLAELSLCSDSNAHEESLRTTVDVPNLLSRVVKEHRAAHASTDDDNQWLGPIVESSDAGLYLCEYIYFCSLAADAIKRRSSKDPKSEPLPVLFIHVPREGHPHSIDSMVDVIQRTISLI